MIEWVTVFSSAIRRIGYDSSIKEMYIDFADSDPYQTYCNVSQDLFYQFVSASSVEHFYDHYIKDQYDC